jgi:hypothetical protein
MYHNNLQILLETCFDMKTSIFWDIMSCSPLKVNQRCGGTCCLHLQGRRISQAKKQREAGSKQSRVVRQPTFRRNISPTSSGPSLLCLLPVSCWILAWLTLRPWRWRRHVPPKRRLSSNGLHGVISQKIELFITNAVRTSNPTCLDMVNN